MDIDPFAAVFMEWQRQWQESPDSFKSDAEAHAASPPTYGDNAARTFRRIALEIGVYVG
jgi:hypothetical protein